MSDHLPAAAQNVGGPEDLVYRSAQARAQATGTSVDAVLAAWAGGGDVAPGAAPAAAPAGAPAPAPQEAAEPSGPEVEVVGAAELASARPKEAAEPAPQPEPEIDQTELVAAGALPRWLMTLFVIVPVIALAYALFLPNGPNCGDAGSLAVDPVTGLAVNCDGSPYGASVFDYFATGAEVYELRCLACHGANGEGGAGPALAGGDVLVTFPDGQCDAHVQWIALATGGWPDATYGATNKPVGGLGVMPGFGGSLSADELAAVAVYERVRFGGLGVNAAEADCSGSSAVES